MYIYILFFICMYIFTAATHVVHLAQLGLAQQHLGLGQPSLAVADDDASVMLMLLLHKQGDGKVRKALWLPGLQTNLRACAAARAQQQCPVPLSVPSSRPVH